MGKEKQIIRICLDCLCVFLVYLPWICLKTVAVPYYRGFYCDDESISYPYRDSTITSTVLIVVGLMLPIVSILVIEGVHVCITNKRGCSEAAYVIGKTEVPFIVVQCYKIIGVFLFGAAANESLTNIAKYSIGRLRPHYLSVCQANYSAFDCVDSHGHQQYITDGDVCTGSDVSKIYNARLSFPSGHASLACFTMVFLALYLQARFTWTGSKLVRPLLQAVVVAMALFTCLSRVSDYKHHWSDVIAGAILGIFLGCLCVFHLTKLLRLNTWSDVIKSESERLAILGVERTSGGSRGTYLTDSGLPGDYQNVTAKARSDVGDNGSCYHVEPPFNDRGATFNMAPIV